MGSMTATNLDGQRELLLQHEQALKLELGTRLYHLHLHWHLKNYVSTINNSVL